MSLGGLSRPWMSKQYDERILRSLLFRATDEAGVSFHDILSTMQKAVWCFFCALC